VAKEAFITSASLFVQGVRDHRRTDGGEPANPVDDQQVARDYVEFARATAV